MMTNQTPDGVLARVAQLEQRVRVLAVVSFALTVIVIAVVALPSANAQGQPLALRARTLTIVDEQGRDRIVIGAPVPNPKEGVRSSPSTGIVINDAAGYERFGLGLFEDNRVVMGFDAPPGTGDPRNRERITLVADASGGAYLRFLNRKTFVPGRLVLDAADQFYLEFLDFPDGKIITRRIGFKGEQTLEEAR